MRRRFPMAHGISRTSTLTGWLLMASLTMMAGCASTARQSSFMSSVEGVDISQEEMRERTNSMAVEFADVIERSGTYIGQHAESPEIRRNALQWKAYLVPAVYAAAFHQDPAIGFLDMTALALQLRDFLNSDTGPKYFASSLPLLKEAIDTALVTLLREARLVREEHVLDQPDNWLEQWVREHPLKQPFVTRPSIASALMHEMREQDRSAVAAVGNMSQEISALSGRLVIYANTLPKVSRWQAEMVLEERLPSLEVQDSVLKEFRHALRVVEGLSERVPVEVTGLAEKSLTSIRPELQLYLDSIDALRVRAMSDVSRERMAITDFIQAERGAALRDIEVLANRVVVQAREELVEGLSAMIWPTMIGLVIAGLIVFWLGVLTGRLRTRRPL